MKPQKKTVTNRKTTKLSMVARKRRPSLEKSVDSDVKEENRVKGQDDSKKRINSEIETEKSSENGKKEKSRKAESIRFKSWKRIRGGFEKKIDRMFDTTEDTNNEVLSDAEQNKSTTSDEILSESLEQCSEESHKKLQNPARLHQQSKIINGTEIIYNYQWNVAGTQSPLPAKKRLKEFEKKSAKLNLDVKTNSKATAAKDSKNIERSTPGREISCKSSLSRTKKKTKAKQSPKKHPQKKTILAIKKSIIPVIKKRPRKEPKLVKCAHVASSLSLPMNEKTIKEAKGAKKMTTSKNKAIQGVILSQNTLEDDLSRVPKQKKTGHSKKKGNVKKGEVVQGSRFSRVESEKDSDEGLSEITKPCFSDKTLLPHPCYIEKEVPGNGGVSRKFRANTKNLINANRRLKKSLRNPKVYSDADFSRSSSFDDDVRNQKSKVTACQLKNATKEENELIKLNVKVERVKDKADSAESDEDFEQKCRSGKETRDKSRVSSEERAMTNRMKLFGFWSGPKRHRVASLNALAKVHCLYENENGGVYLGGFCKPKIEKEKCKDMDNRIDRKELDDGKKSIMDKKNKDEDHSLNSMRKLRNVPGLRGKHYDIFEASTSSSSDEGSKSPKVTQKGRRRKEKLTVKSSRMRERESRKVELEKIKNREGDIKRNLKSAPDRKNDQKRRKKSAETIDLKNMVGSKRMASLNASAILAASYSDEKNRIGTSSDTSSSNESDMEFFKIRKASDIDVDSTKQHQSGSDVDDLLNPSKKVVIVNQDTDVTITGVYVNQTRSTHHEGFCSIAGMQYRISSTSHTQTAATAVSAELQDQKEQPSKSYTPLGALSSMQPPGSQGNHSDMSPRRHSAFSAPHQHGYYQPAGPLIQHPPSLHIKGPPPDSTPPPPQNSESSDELITSAMPGAVSNIGGGFYRSYCPQYYATPPQYQELCYPPSYLHSHRHPSSYYKYAPPYRRQYHGYQESGPVEGPGSSGAGHGVVEFHSPPGEYLPPYYSGYPSTPAPLPLSSNPAYMHSQGHPFVDHAFESCPCPMQSCPKNVDTGPLIGNGKGAPVASGPGLSLPPSALVGPPSPVRGLAGLAPLHGANAWDTDRVQFNPLHRSHHAQQQGKHQKQPMELALEHRITGEEDRPVGSMVYTAELRRPKLEPNTTDDSYAMDPVGVTRCLLLEQCPSLKIHSNNVKCDACSRNRYCRELSISCTCCGEHDFSNEPNREKSESSDQVADGEERQQQQWQRSHCHSHSDQPSSDRKLVLPRLPQAKRPTRPPSSSPSCSVKCESDENRCGCDCEQCANQSRPGIEMDKDSGILVDDPGTAKFELGSDTSNIKQEFTSALLLIDTSSWKKLDFEFTAPTIDGDNDGEKTVEPIEDVTLMSSRTIVETLQQKQQKNRRINKRKSSLDSPLKPAHPNKVSKRTMSVDFFKENALVTLASSPIGSYCSEKSDDPLSLKIVAIRKPKTSRLLLDTDKECTPQRGQKRKSGYVTEGDPPVKRPKVSKTMASEISIMQTINEVIQQSVQMSQEFPETKNCEENLNQRVEEKSEQNNLRLSTLRIETGKESDYTKNSAPGGLVTIKNEFESSHPRINNKINAKTKSRILFVKKKNFKVKGKDNTKNMGRLIKSKDSKVLNSENINEFVDIENSQIPAHIKNNKVLEMKKNKILANKSNKLLDTKNCQKAIDSMNSRELLEPKYTNRLSQSKNINKIIESNITDENQEASSKYPEDSERGGVTKPKVLHKSSPNFPLSSDFFSTKDAKSMKFRGKISDKVSESEKGQKKTVLTGNNCKTVKEFFIREESNCRAGEQTTKGMKRLSILKKPSLKPKWSNGWSWEGEAFEAKVYLTNEESAVRRCYIKMRHESGDILQPRDCVLLKSGPRKADLPFVAKIAALWENPDDGEMMFSLLWYYRPEHTEQGRTEKDSDDEVFASRHRDANSVACIEDKCYILNFHEYCRYRKNIRRIEEGLDSPGLIVPPGDQRYPRETRIPQMPVPQDLVLFCRRVYDYRGKKLVKNPG